MVIKKIGIWAGGFVGSFIILLILFYFLFPYLKPDKAEIVKKQQQANVKMAYFDPGRSNSQAVDSLNKRITNQQEKLDSLTKMNSHKQQAIDSLTQILKDRKESAEKMAVSRQQHHAVSVKEASKSLLSLDENSLGPIVNLLDQDQLINLYENGSSRQREKLLRTLDPKKAAAILQKVMK
jgi:hypothetical protein